MTNSFIRISNGKLVDLLNPQPEDIDLYSINRALNTIRRFTGHWETKAPLTVAQHTGLVMEVAARTFPNELDVEFDCLLHDMPEAYYNDISSPMKRCLSLKDFVEPIDRMLYETLWICPSPFTQEVKKKRKYCDLVALTIERNNMWNGREDDDNPLYFPNVDLNFTRDEQEGLFNMFSASTIDLEEIYNSYKEDFS